MVFLLDVDNTLLDNDRFIADLRQHLECECGHERSMEYWAFLQKLHVELGYDDYLGALQDYHAAHAHDPHVIEISRFIIDYPFADRLFPGALDVIARLKRWAEVVILSDGDVVFQPRKIELAGLYKAVDGRVLIYTHKEKEISDVKRRCPADRYVVIDDKLGILAAFKKLWGSNVTTILIRQGVCAKEEDESQKEEQADLSFACIAELLHDNFEHDLRTL